MFHELPFHNEDEINTFNENDLSYKLGDIERMCFNPLELNTPHGNNYLTDNTDYEVQFKDQLNNRSNYYFEATFNSHVTDLGISENETISVLHINARSLKKHYTELLCLVNNLQHSFSIIVVSESWLDPTTDQLYHIPGFVPFPLSRPKRQGGGIVLYIRDTIISCRLRDDDKNRRK